MNSALRIASSYRFFANDTALSEEAGRLREMDREVASSTERSQALFGDKAEAIQAIYSLYEECAEDDWDGNDGRPMSPGTVERAIDMVSLLPHGIPLPEFSAEPDGSISMDWTTSRKSIFSLSIGRTDRIPYAWVDGAERGDAVAAFDGREIPKRILDEIGEIIRRDSIQLRATFRR